jgi:hypothetical protein
LKLVSISRDREQRQKQLKKELLTKASRLLAYEEICAKEDELRNLTLSDLGNQFGIRHITLLIGFIAVTLALFQNVGPAAGAFGGLLSAVIILLYFVEDRFQNKKRLFRMRKTVLNRQIRNGHELKENK